MCYMKKSFLSLSHLSVVIRSKLSFFSDHVTKVRDATIPTFSDADGGTARRNGTERPPLGAWAVAAKAAISG